MRIERIEVDVWGVMRRICRTPLTCSSAIFNMLTAGLSGCCCSTKDFLAQVSQSCKAVAVVHVSRRDVGDSQSVSSERTMASQAMDSDLLSSFLYGLMKWHD